MVKINGFFAQGASLAPALLMRTEVTLSPPSGGDAAAIPAHEVRGAQFALSAPAVTSESSVAVAIRGQPRWRDSGVDRGQHANDAAAVADGYRRFGRDFLARLGGSFAIAIADIRSNRLLLAIDRLGIERLAYCVTPDGIVFGSSAEQVARRIELTTRIDPQALYDYLFFHMVPSPRTMFSGVAKLPPAVCLEYADGRHTLHTYWRPQFNTQADGNIAQLRDELMEALEVGVRDSGIDDKSGAFLSGGLDSSTIAGVLAKVGPGRARTFSIGFDTADFDELAYARIAARRFNCDAHEYVAKDSDIVMHFAAIARAYDEPFGNASALPTLCCALLARSHGVDHLLAGDGGDELFAGNTRYADQQIFERYGSLPGFTRRGFIEPVVRALQPLAGMLDVIRRANNYLRMANTPLPRRLEAWNLLARLGLENVLHADFLHGLDRDAPQRHMDLVYQGAGDAAVVDKMLYYDWRFTLADNDLRKVETMCELAGVRVSYPMLDNAVVDMSTRVPAGLKLRNGQLRFFYKEAMREFLPKEILHKTKHGFGLPFGFWLQESQSLRDLIYGNLSSLRSRRIVSAELLDKLDGLNSGDDARYYGVLIWVLAMLEQWLAEHRLTV